jgi:hypothetical protein
MSSTSTPTINGPSRLPHLAQGPNPTAPSTSGDSESTAQAPFDRGLDTSILKELARSALVEKLNDVGSAPPMPSEQSAGADGSDPRAEDVDPGPGPRGAFGPGHGGRAIEGKARVIHPEIDERSVADGPEPSRGQDVLAGIRTAQYRYEKCSLALPAETAFDADHRW